MTCACTLAGYGVTYVFLSRASSFMSQHNVNCGSSGLSVSSLSIAQLVTCLVAHIPSTCCLIHIDRSCCVEAERVSSVLASEHFMVLIRNSAKAEYTNGTRKEQNHGRTYSTQRMMSRSSVSSYIVTCSPQIRKKHTVPLVQTCSPTFSTNKKKPPMYTHTVTPLITVP